MARSRNGDGAQGSGADQERESYRIVKVSSKYRQSIVKVSCQSPPRCCTPRKTHHRPVLGHVACREGGSEGGVRGGAGWQDGSTSVWLKYDAPY